MQFKKSFLIAIHHAVLVIGCLALPVHAGAGITLTHVHGLSYTADGKQIMIPSHHGLAVYKNGRWTKAKGPAHDYMGFSATRDTLYSSGHPAPGSNMTNPLGLIMSRDNGKTWKELGLQGESDFHTMATGYGNNAIYVINHGRNSRMPDAGIYHTRNDGLRWTHADARGLSTAVNSLAVHPDDPDIVAVGAEDGLYLSRDSAQNFEQWGAGLRTLSVMFDLAGEHLWFGTYSRMAGLSRVTLKGEVKVESIALPGWSDDAVAYIAQNPANHDEITVATFKRSVWMSKDKGNTWMALARFGTTL